METALETEQQIFLDCGKLSAYFSKVDAREGASRATGLRVVSRRVKAERVHLELIGT